MLNEFTGKEVVEKIMDKPETTDGFDQLKTSKRLELTIENFILKSKYRKLFYQSHRDKAYNRLYEAGFDPEEQKIFKT
jgi:hypothetical protein